MSELQYKCEGCGASITFDPATQALRCTYCGQTYDVAAVEKFGAPATAPATEPPPGEGVALPAPGEGVAQPAPGDGVAQPAPGYGVAQPAPGYGVAQPAPGEGVALPAPGDGVAQPAPAAEGTWQASPEKSLGEAVQQTMTQFSCASCGGEIIGAPEMVSTRCPYCDNNVISPTTLTSTRMPDRMIPFTITKAQLVDIFAKETAGLRFLPGDFRSSHSLSEAQGVYVPYWLYDCDVIANFTFTGDKTQTYQDAHYEYTQTDHYELYRGGTMGFDDVPVIATTDLTPELAEGIEPFDYKAAQPFATAYLAGYSANTFNVTPEVANARANQRIRESAAREFRSTVSGYDNTETKSDDVQFVNGLVELVFLPTYLLNLRYGGATHRFAVNGQTGKLVGTFPISKAKVWSYFAGWSLAATALLSGPAIYFVARFMS